MEYYLRLYIKENFNKSTPENLTADQLLSFIVNLSYSQGFEEGYGEGVESQKKYIR